MELYWAVAGLVEGTCSRAVEDTMLDAAMVAVAGEQSCCICSIVIMASIWQICAFKPSGLQEPQFAPIIRPGSIC
eukprot:6826191-Ditylum_brightwellii.AAC.1